ncbi:MAG: TIGR04076 family protein [Thermomicrobia bacterium]|nr:TIGR04076 family protein [Thermomicrobia bacterium]MCA1725049.1 TIGR04076 family protein [Thermomicrobia bacterium]
MDASRFTLYDLRITVVAIEGRSICGLAVGDSFEVTESNRLCIPAGRHFCLYSLGAVLPLLSGYQRAAQSGDWMMQESLVACPDPDECLTPTFSFPSWRPCGCPLGSIGGSKTRWCR